MIVPDSLLPPGGPPLPVLVYHRVDTSGEPYTTTPAVFRRHLEWLAANDYRTVSTAQLDRALSDLTVTLPPRSVLLTVDDGFSCLADRVAPLLAEHGFTGVGFLITDQVGQPGHLSWDGARDLDLDGVIEFHSHSHSHRTWPLGLDSVAGVADDLRRSRDLLAQRLDRPITTFTHLAWPYGRTCPAWEVAADRLGFRTQYVVQRGAVDRWDRTRRLPRLLADGMAPDHLARWLRTLGNPLGARLGNQLFGSIRQVRRGAAYR